jgi:SagB-type dehydrogenase family enzyme
MNQKFNISKLLNKPIEKYQQFHKDIFLNKIDEYKKNNKQVPISWETIYYKAYNRFPQIMLPKPKLDTKLSFKKILLERESSRDFDSKPVTIQKISTLLYYSLGLISPFNKNSTRRFYPSAGARYPLETYVIANNSQLINGIYHYYILNHSIERIDDIEKKMLRKCFVYDWTDCSFIILISAIFKRNVVKYGNRGYKQILIETGHIGQNIYLVASNLRLNCCGIDGYYDNKINKLIDIDGFSEAVLYAFAIGEKKL